MAKQSIEANYAQSLLNENYYNDDNIFLLLKNIQTKHSAFINLEKDKYTRKKKWRICGSCI